MAPDRSGTRLRAAAPPQARLVSADEGAYRVPGFSGADGGPVFLFKKILIAGLDVPGIARAFELAIRGRASVFMLHRFAVPDLGVVGHDPEAVRAALGWLRRKGYALLTLEEVFRRLSEDPSSLTRAVAFTADDGYFDTAEIAVPIFAEYDCPLSTFVCTGFLDGEMWMWWDRIEYVFRHCARAELTARVGGTEHRHHWDGDAERLRAQLDFTERCKDVVDTEREAAIADLARSAGVELPAAPPAAYAPMAWDRLRACEGRGMSFGPHTVTHPILSRTDDDQARREIDDSWARLREESTHPLPIFCYPNGQRGDFGPREYAILADLGMEGAVVGYSGYATLADEAPAAARFTVRRFGFDDSIPQLAQCVTGFERVKARLRGAK